MTPSVCCLAPQEAEKRNQGVDASRHRLAEQSVRVGTHAPAGAQGGILQFIVVLDDDVEFAQGAIDIAVDEEKVRRLPRHIGSGGLGLQRAIQCRSLAREIAGHLIGRGQIQPTVGIVGVERYGRSKVVDRRLRVAGHKRKVPSEPMAIVGVSWRQTHRAFQGRQLRTRSENAGRKFRARKKEIDAGEKNQNHSHLPTPPV